MEEPVFVHSWDMDMFRLGSGTLGNIKRHLNDHKYFMPETPPSDLAVKVVNKLLVAIHSKQLADETPWFVVLSNVSEILTTCANILPVSFALSTAREVRTVSVDSLVRLFFAPPVINQWTDEEEAQIVPVKASGFLVVNSIAEPVSGASKHAGRFYDLFLHRAHLKLPTLFTSPIDSDSGVGTVKELYSKIKANVGTGTADMIQDLAVNLQIQSAKTPPKLEKVVI